jgi:hypothetical protein
MTPLYTSLSDSFDRHDGQMIGYALDNLDIPVVPQKHYDIRAFHSTDILLPWTMNDMKLWNAFYFSNQTIQDLGLRRSVSGRTFRNRTMDELSVAVDGGGTDTTFETMGSMDRLTMRELDLYILSSGNEDWPSNDPDVVVGKDAFLRYANAISIALTDSQVKTVVSHYPDDILTDFNEENQTYYIELVLRNLPAQSDVARLDLNKSFIDFSSEDDFSTVDSVAFSESENNLMLGGDTIFQIKRNRLVNADIANLKAIRFRLYATAAPLTAPIASEDTTAGTLTGIYDYVVTFVIAGTETTVSPISNAVTLTAEQMQVQIPLGPTGTTARKVYRRLNGAGSFLLVATVADNTTLVVTDNATTGAAAPSSSTLGNMTFKAQAMRLLPTGFISNPIDTDTKRGNLTRFIPRTGSPESTGVLGNLYWSETRPKNVTHVAKFNSGHSPTGNDNVIRLFYRYNDDLQRKIEVDLFSRDTQSRLRIYQTLAGVTTEVFSTPTNTNILTNETDYYLVVEVIDTQVRATIYAEHGIFLGTQIYTTGWQTVGFINRGASGFSFEPYNYDFTLDFIGTQRATFANFESTVFLSRTPVVGSTLLPNASPMVDMCKDNPLVAVLDATLTGDESDLTVTRQGTQWLGGIQCNDPIYIGDSSQVRAVGEIYPITQVQGHYYAVLLDRNQAVAWIQEVPNLLPNQWNTYSLPLPDGIVPSTFNFWLVQGGFYAGSFRVRNVKLDHNTISWYGSANAGTNWQPFLNAIGQEFSGVKFGVLDVNLKVKAVALSDKAWIQGYELVPHYKYPGHNSP